jgi:PAS domain S-box-containing protein
MGKPRHLYLLPAWLAAAAIVALSAYISWKEWRTGRAMAEASVLNAARILAHQVESSLDGADALLNSIRDRGDGALDPAFVERLRQEVPYHPLVARVGILDARGFLVFTTGPVSEPHRLDFSTRDYFLRARAGETGRIFSGPLQAALRGEWTLVLARRLEGRDGSFRGLVYAALPVASIGKAFAGVDLGRSGVINLRTLDFAQVVRHPPLAGADRGHGNRNISRTIQDLMARDPGRDEYLYRTVAPIDGVERIYTYRKFDHSPFWMTVGRATGEFATAWRQTAALLTGLSVALSGLLLWGARRLERQNLSLAEGLEQEARAKRNAEASEARFRSAEAAVQEAAERFRQVSEAAQEWIWEVDAEGLYTYASPAVNQLLGRAPEDLVGRLHFFDLWPPEDRQQTLARARRVFSTGAPFRDFPNVCLHRSGRKVYLETNGVAILDPDGRVRGYRGVDRDVSEREAAEADRQRLERELEHLRRLDSLGRLVAGISHDMNNVLGSIMGIAATLKLRHPDDPAIAREADVLHQSAIRGRDLVKGLRDFSRKELDAAGEVDLNALARREADLLERTTLKKVQVRLELAPELPPVLGDSSAIANTLMNLCTNAVDAMPKGGSLVLSTRDLGQGYVELAVADTGEGMSPQVLARAMEPFFTTKPVGEGTGLGLSQAYGTMKAHGGTLALASEPGRGTRASLTFPAAADPERTAPPAPEAAPGPAARSLAVLLVDDEDLFRDASRLLLESLGHRVEAVRSAPEALERLHSGAPVDLLMLDLNMPGMDGAEALRRARAVRPVLAVLLCTGYPDDRVPELLKDHADVRLLDKPFTLRELGRTLGGWS